MSDRRPLVVLLVVIVLAVGAVALTRKGGNSAAPPPLAPVNTAVSTTVTSIADAPKAPSATTSDWRNGLDQVVAAENKAFSDPKSADVSSFMLKTCSCYQQTLDTVNALKAKNQHVDGANIVVTSSLFVDAPADNRVRVTMRFRPDGKNTVDSSGKVVEASPSGEFAPLIYTLEKQADGSWRIADRRAYEERGS